MVLIVKTVGVDKIAIGGSGLRALSFIIWAKASEEPAICSAIPMAASLPEASIRP